MRIIDLLHKKGIELDFHADSKQTAIDRLVDLMDATGNLKNKEEYKQAILAREEQGTTGIGEGVAIPHAKTAAVNNAGLAAAVSQKGIDFQSLDGTSAHLFFMIAVPAGGNNLHIEVLSRLSTILMDEKFRQTLISAKDKDVFLNLINEKEQEKFGANQDVENENKASQNNEHQVLAVTACPTGIAHTYMAAESLANKAKEMGISIKVETNGSTGVKNALTKEEIGAAKCIIVAADKKIEMARFEGKKVIQTKVADGIHKAEQLLNRAINGDAPIYHHRGSEVTGGDLQHDEGVGRRIYKHLMNGVSHMLPFVIGGGLLIALAFLFDDYSINPSKFGSNTPLAAFLMKVGSTAFGFMLPVLAGYIAMSIGDRPALSAGFIGGLLASNGGSGFLGALLAGFIAGYLVILLKKVLSVFPSALEGLKPVLFYPLLGTLSIGIIIIFLVNPPVSAINNSLTDFLNSMGSASKIILGAILGGMMAIDMGGPINKAAYVFGTAALTTGQFDIMAAVMIGGMVPPLAIALTTTFFKSKFTKRERQSGLTNYVMGLSFITEGAIPFAAADPARVIPASFVGAAVAGALSMAFGCALRAPHGGIFVVPVISNPFGYLGALMIGSVVGMLILGLLKRTVVDD